MMQILKTAQKLQRDKLARTCGYWIESRRDRYCSAPDYIRDALQWLIDDGVVTRFDIDVRWVRRSFLGARVTA